MSDSGRSTPIDCQSDDWVSPISRHFGYWDHTGLQSAVTQGVNRPVARCPRSLSSVAGLAVVYTRSAFAQTGQGFQLGHEGRNRPGGEAAGLQQIAVGRWVRLIFTDE